MGYRERRLRRAERLREWSDKREVKSAAAFKTARTIADGIPFGQPILVGHHSERHARRDQGRIHNAMSAGVQHHEKACDMDGRASEIERQAEQAIYSDDADAPERLRERIADFEAERARMKAENVAYRKGDAAYAAFLGITLEQAQARRVTIDAGYSWCRQPHPSYSLQNLGGNITRQRKRLAQLAPDVPAEHPVIAGATATERAGLLVVAGMTTPRRAGKQPRPVWTVTGQTAAFRRLLLDLGGTSWQGTISFWDDPSWDLEAALLQREQDTAASQELTPVETEQNS